MRTIEQTFYPARHVVGVHAPRPVVVRAAARPVPVSHPAPPAHPARSTRLTRRGRLVVHGGAVILLAAVGVVSLLGFTGTAQAGDETRSVPVAYHEVLPGETLWAIAGEHAPDVDRRETIARIVELNALPGESLSAGQRIALPHR